MLSKYDSFDFEILKYKVLCAGTPVLQQRWWSRGLGVKALEPDCLVCNQTLDVASFENLNKHLATPCLSFLSHALDVAGNTK